MAPEASNTACAAWSAPGQYGVGILQELTILTPVAIVAVALDYQPTTIERPTIVSPTTMLNMSKPARIRPEAPATPGISTWPVTRMRTGS
jgi:hypothetical protein